jgi:hypothetical protein
LPGRAYVKPSRPHWRWTSGPGGGTIRDIAPEREMVSLWETEGEG